MNNGDKPASPAKVTVNLNPPRGSGYPASKEVEYSGLTKREMIAMHIMSSLLSDPDPKTFGLGMDKAAPMISAQSVVFADALLKQLEDSNNGN